MSYKVGVDVGGTNVRVALGNHKGKIASRLNERSDKLSGPAGISHQVIRMIRFIAPVSRIHSIGVGAAGPLDLKDGSIVHSPQFGFDRIPLVKPLEKEFRVPVYLVNDCQAAVIAEKELGQGKKYANLVYVTISSGIGAGVFVDNHLLIGKDGNAHEVGHVTIDCAGKLRCGCGRRGHWEAYCGGANASNFIRFQLESKSCAEIKRSLLYKTSRGNLNNLSSEDLMESAGRRDKLALEIVEEMGRLNAIGFANITNAYDPELITVGGAVALANPSLILKPIRRLIGQYSLNRIPRIRITRLGGEAVLRGALTLSRQLR
jgi:glucokinase